MSRSHDLHPAKNLRTPFPPFVKGLSPIVHHDVLCGSPWKQLTTVTRATFLGTYNANGRQVEETTNFGRLLRCFLFANGTAICRFLHTCEEFFFTLTRWIITKVLVHLR